jgi:serine/threonine protein kinase
MNFFKLNLILLLFIFFSTQSSAQNNNSSNDLLNVPKSISKTIEELKSIHLIFAQLNNIIPGSIENSKNNYLGRDHIAVEMNSILTMDESQLSPPQIQLINDIYDLSVNLALDDLPDQNLKNLLIKVSSDFGGWDNTQNSMYAHPLFSCLSYFLKNSLIDHQSNVLVNYDLFQNEVGVLTKDDYYIISNKLLGKGSYKSVYKAYARHHQDVALSITTTQKSNEKLTFEIDILKFLKNINHNQEFTGIIKVLEAEVIPVSENENREIIVTKLMNFGSLKDFVINLKNKKEQILDISEREKIIHEQGPVTFLIIGQLIKGLLKLHQLNIAHRDIKLENIFLHQNHFNDKNNNPNTLPIESVHADFGLSLKLELLPENFHQQKYRFMGTHYYSSPEIGNYQIFPDNEAMVNFYKTADWWSMGVTILNTLTLNWPNWIYTLENSIKEKIQNLNQQGNKFKSELEEKQFHKKHFLNGLKDLKQSDVDDILNNFPSQHILLPLLKCLLRVDPVQRCKAEQIKTLLELAEEKFQLDPKLKVFL